MVINGSALLNAHPIYNMLDSKEVAHGTSYGLTEAGYDLRLKQEVRFLPFRTSDGVPGCQVTVDGHSQSGRFTLASAMEEFAMPSCLMGIVHDKSTWARRGLSVFNTVIEPGWKGFLTLELVYHGDSELAIPAGSGIAQVIFHQLICPGRYAGKYQNQADQPVPAKESITP